jgi:resolvase domain protein
MSPGTVARQLNENGVRTKRDGNWTGHTVNGMIRNEKYTGDVILQKTYSDDRFKRHINRGEWTQYLVKDHHEAIVSHEDFDANGLEKASIRMRTSTRTVTSYPAGSFAESAVAHGNGSS